jgi:hypothetical protein
MVKGNAPYQTRHMWLKRWTEKDVSSATHRNMSKTCMNETKSTFERPIWKVGSVFIRLGAIYEYFADNFLGMLLLGWDIILIRLI